MSGVIVVQKGRTNILSINVGMNVADDTITSEIRTASGSLIATWTVAFAGDGSDGELLLTLDNTITTAITQPSGLMDLKRVSAGEPYAIFEKPLEVEFRNTVTV